ncbi:9661_t:CDS:1, partial [Gigaspora rosea]
DENALSAKEMGNTNDENGLNKTPKNINDKNALLAQEIDDKKKKIPKDTTYEQVTEL